MPWWDPDPSDLDETGYAEEREVRCKNCNERDLYWEEARGERNQKKWVLVDDEGKVHECPAFKGAGPTPDGAFKDLRKLSGK